ncbi:MAG: CoA synthetase [Candidatus Rokubacteria bacterium]|nr:CoA synthetase [Candidatus Rokubacteria bacterium]
MAAVIARAVDDRETVAVGTLSPIPAAGVLLARSRHAPRARVIIINHEDCWPFHNGSKEFYDFAQRRKIDLFFLSGGQIDQFGNLNLITIGEHDHPKVRLPGGAGSAMLYYLAGRVMLFRADHTPRTFVERVDCVTSPGTSPPRVLRPGGPWKVVTPLAVFAFNRERGRLELESVHPGVSVAEVQSSTGFPLRSPGHVPTTSPPDEQDLAILRGPVRESVATLYPIFARTAFLAA